MGLKLAHCTVVTPGRCGLYETTRELVVALRALGVDSRIVDPTFGFNVAKYEDAETGLEIADPPKCHPDDRGALMASVAWAKSADVLINHSGLGKKLEATDQPVIHVAHGRPRSTFLIELKGGTPVMSYHYHKNKDPRFKAVVTFWPAHKPYHEIMWPDTPVHCVQPPVDLEAWTPDGPRGYGFHGKKGTCNVVVADAWRMDIDPFPVVNAFAIYARKFKGAKLHVYGCSKDLKGWGPLFKSIQEQGNLGEVLPWVSGLANVYRAADMLITPHTIMVRSIREAMACGCPVAMMATPDVEKFAQGMEIVRVTDRREVRARAEKLFNPERTAVDFLHVVNCVRAPRPVEERVA